MGGGSVGQLVQQVARRAGVAHVTMVEPSPFRRSIAAQLGADEAVTPFDAREQADAQQLEPFDHVFECSGHADALQLSIDLLAAGGSVRLVGMAPRPVSFDSVSAITKEISILTGFIYNAEFAAAIPLLASGAIDVDPLTTTVVDLDHYAEAFEALHEPEHTLKALIGSGP